LGVRYQNYTGKAIFMPLSIGVGIAVKDFSITGFVMIDTVSETLPRTDTPVIGL
jgi:hypothetical protein